VYAIQTLILCCPATTPAEGIVKLAPVAVDPDCTTSITISFVPETMSVKSPSLFRSIKIIKRAPKLEAGPLLFPFTTVAVYELPIERSPV
jgi:hypothetical protein